MEAQSNENKAHSPFLHNAVSTTGWKEAQSNENKAHSPFLYNAGATAGWMYLSFASRRLLAAKEKSMNPSFITFPLDCVKTSKFSACMRTDLRPERMGSSVRKSILRDKRNV